MGDKSNPKYLATHGTAANDPLIDESQSLLQAIDIAILVVNGDVRLTRFNAKAEALFGLDAQDRGRRLSESAKLADLGLPSLVGEVLDADLSVGREASTRDDRWFFVRGNAYRDKTTDDGAWCSR